MRGYCRSEHFPYEQSSIELLMTHQPLREAMSRLCASCNLARLDEAFRIILGQWHADNGTGRTVLDVLTKAKASARPDIFGGFTPLAPATGTGQRDRPDTPPQWLVDVLNRFQMGTVGIECTAFTVSYNGLEVRVATHAAAPEPEVLARLTSPRDVLMLLMSVEAGMLGYLQPTGGDHQ
jgi:hypothetical protein